MASFFPEDAETVDGVTPGTVGLEVLAADTEAEGRDAIDAQAYHVNLAAIAAGTWTGAASITTLGTIGTGVWQGTAVAAGYGGTGQTTYTVGDILYASTTTALSKLAAGTANYVLKSGGPGVAPSWVAIGGLSAGIGNLATTLDGASQPNNRAWGMQWIPGVGSCWAPVGGWGGMKCQRLTASQSISQINDAGTGTSDVWDAAPSTSGTAVGGYQGGRRHIMYSTTTLCSVAPNGSTYAIGSMRNVATATYGIVTYSDVTNSRIKVYGGTNTAVSTQLGSTTPAGSWIEVRCDTGAGDTTWNVVSSNGASQETTNTGITVAASTSYDICFSFPTSGTSVQVWMSVSRGVWTLVATHSTYLPAATDGFYSAAACLPLSGTRGIGFSNLTVVSE